MEAKKVKFHLRVDRTEQLIGFTYDMIRAVKMGGDELSKEQYLELHQIEETLGKMYKHVKEVKRD